jgi:hypothetical protein
MIRTWYVGDDDYARALSGWLMVTNTIGRRFVLV